MNLLEKLNSLNGREVIAILSQYATLPAQGLASGQAAASAVLQLLGVEGCSVFNDVDVFVLDRDFLADANLLRQELDEGPVPAIVALNTLSGYDGVSAASGSALFIKQVSYVNRLNIIQCQMRDSLVPWCDGVTAPQFAEEGQYAFRDDTSKGTLVPHVLLQSFDLNCVQVAVDLATGDLHWTREFENFVRTREIRLTNTWTPLRSVVRAMEKAQQMPGAFFNEAATITQAHLRLTKLTPLDWSEDGWEVAAAGSPLKHWTGTAHTIPMPSFEWHKNRLIPDIGAIATDSRFVLGEVMGSHRAERLKPFAHKLKEHLTLVPLPIPELTAAQRKRCMEREIRMMELPTYVTVPQRAVSRVFEDSIFEFVGSSLPMTEMLEKVEGRFRVAEALLYPGARAEVVRMRAALYASETGKRRGRHVQGWVSKMMTLHGVSFFDQNATSDQYRDLAEAVMGHKTGLDLVDRVSLQLEVLQLLAQAKKRFPLLGEGVFGLAEHGRLSLTKLTRSGRIVPVCLEALIGQLHEQMAVADADQPERLIEPGLFGDAQDVYIEHLTRAEELLGEGARMHHCVGGYAFSDRAHKELIFAARHVPSGTRVTIQARRHPSVGKCSVTQCYGPFNSAVKDSAIHLKLETALVQALKPKGITLEVSAVLRPERHLDYSRSLGLCPRGLGPAAQEEARTAAVIGDADFEW